MIAYTDLVVRFTDKLNRTGSMDAALLHVVWVAYKAGRADAINGGQPFSKGEADAGMPAPTQQEMDV
jgi:hypothetical protein